MIAVPELLSLPDFAAPSGSFHGERSVRTFPHPDEALRHRIDNARFMRNECSIMECLETRQRSSALLPWRLAPERPDLPAQRALADELTTLVRRVPRFLEYRRNLLEALWYGRYAVTHVWEAVEVAGQRRYAVVDWEPRCGDKLVFRSSRSSPDGDPRGVGIRVSKPPAEGTSDRDRYVRTAEGWVYFLSREERPLLALHQHLIEDGPPEEQALAGSRFGVGIRSRVYWSWYSLQECLSYLMEFLERSALGIEIWSYPSGNAEAEKATRKAAQERIGGGRSIVLVPKPPGDQAQQFGVQHIEPGLGGAEALQSVITDYFSRKIKRYVLGQTLTSESEATGLGSGVARAHQSTFDDVVRYDAQKLAETLTTDLVEPLKTFNFPDAKGVGVRFEFLLNEEEPGSRAA